MLWHTFLSIFLAEQAISLATDDNCGKLMLRDELQLVQVYLGGVWGIVPSASWQLHYLVCLCIVVSLWQSCHAKLLAPQTTLAIQVYKWNELIHVSFNDIFDVSAWSLNECIGLLPMPVVSISRATQCVYQTEGQMSGNVLQCQLRVPSIWWGTCASIITSKYLVCACCGLTAMKVCTCTAVEYLKHFNT